VKETKCYCPYLRLEGINSTVVVIDGSRNIRTGRIQNKNPGTLEMPKPLCVRYGSLVKDVRC
jgi:hypothetical protein